MPRSDSGVTRRRLLGLAAAATAGLAGCAEATRPTVTYEPPDQVRTRPADAPTQPTGTPPDGEFRQVYEATVDSVAVVRTDDGQGTCYAIDDTRMVTNQHVVEDADTVDLQFASDAWTTAEVVGTDVFSDLAVLSAPGRPASATALELVEYPPVAGQEVVVIGTPFGLRGTVTTGVVSGVNRVLDAASGFSVPGAIQTDAAVNPGNSGGPLLSLDGEVVGVISAAGGENIAFGIPPQLVRRVVPDLIEFGDYQHPFLGIGLEEVTPAIARANDLARTRGVVVTNVVENGPSEGVLRAATDTEFVDGERVPVGGDVIVGVRDRPITSTAGLLAELAFRTFPGDDLPVTVVRDGEELTVTVTVGVRPEP
jgi:S1-C subfamily serine protease